MQFFCLATQNRLDCQKWKGDVLYTSWYAFSGWHGFGLPILAMDYLAEILFLNYYFYAAYKPRLTYFHHSGQSTDYAIRYFHLAGLIDCFVSFRSNEAPFQNSCTFLCKPDWWRRLIAFFDFVLSSMAALSWF